MNASMYVSVTSFLALEVWLAVGRAASGNGTVTTNVDNCLRGTFTNDVCIKGGFLILRGDSTYRLREMRTRKRKEVQKCQNVANITCE